MQELLEPLVSGTGLWQLLFLTAVSIAILGKSADSLVDQAVLLSVRSGLPQIVIGATIVSLGTTMPEATVSVLAAFNGEPGMALGNAVGSVICDTGLILGLACLLTPLPLNRARVNRQGWIQFGAGVLLILVCIPWGNLGPFTATPNQDYFEGHPLSVSGETETVLDNALAAQLHSYLSENDYVTDGSLTDAYRDARKKEALAPLPATLQPHSEAIFLMLDSIGAGTLHQHIGWLFILLLAVYMIWSVRAAKNSDQILEQAADEAAEAGGVAGPVTILIVATLFLVASSAVLISATTELAEHRLHVPTSIFAATLVAFGTSLPELVTALTAVKKKQGELAVGNVIGADILNVLFVSGAAAAVTSEGLAADPSMFELQFPAMLFVLLIFRVGIFTAKSGKLTRPFGALLLIVYLIYLVLNVNRMSL